MRRPKAHRLQFFSLRARWPFRVLFYIFVLPLLTAFSLAVAYFWAFPG